MYNSRLIKQLRTLSPVEINRFSAYLESHFWGISTKSIKLGMYLIGLYPDFPEDALKKETLYNLLFPESGEFENQALHDQFSLLNKTFHHFLGLLQYEKDEEQQSLNVMRSFAERRDKDNLQRSLKKAENSLKAAGGAGPHTYLQQYLYHHQANSVFQSRSLTKKRDMFGEMVNDLDRFYLSNKLKYACEMLNRQAILNIAYDQSLTDKLIIYLFDEGRHWLADPLINLYSKVYLLLKQPEDQNYQQILSNLQKNQEAIDSAEVANIYAFLQNYCIKQLNSGNGNYLAELFRLYQILLEKELLFDSNGHISHAHVKNIVAVGLRLEKYDWVKGFLETYTPRVQPLQREDVFHYNLAQYHYEQKQYREALKLLIQINYTDVFYQLDARALQMKIYYEMGEDDSLLYLVKAFKTFLKRNKELSRNQYSPYENLLTLAQKAYRLKNQKASLSTQKFEEKLNRLKQAIQAAQGIANKHWLSRKVKELEF